MKQVQDEDRSLCLCCLTVPEMLWVLGKIECSQVYTFCSV